MKIKVIIHQAEEGGYWAEVPAILGCLTQGDSWEELIKNIYEVVEACLSVDVEKIKIKPSDKILDVAIWKTFLAKNYVCDRKSSPVMDICNSKDLIDGGIKNEYRKDW